MIADRLQWCCKFDHKRKEIGCRGEIIQRLNMLKFVSYKVGRSTLTSLYKSPCTKARSMGMLFGTTVLTVTHLYLIVFNTKLQDW